MINYLEHLILPTVSENSIIFETNMCLFLFLTEIFTVTVGLIHLICLLSLENKKEHTIFIIP